MYFYVPPFTVIPQNKIPKHGRGYKTKLQALERQLYSPKLGVHLY